MRMWKADPSIMCRQHLLGEHVEMHMFAGTFRRNISFKGYMKNGLIDTNMVEERHDDLVAEMIKRGYNHNSPIDSTLCEGIANKYKYEDYEYSEADNLKELLRRCVNCSSRFRRMWI